MGPFFFFLTTEDLHILKKASAPTKHEFNQPPFEKSQQPVPFKQDKARVPLCAKG